MKKAPSFFSGFLFLSSVVLAQPPARAHARNQPQITVRIQNQANVSSASMAEIRRVASDILHQAGIDVHWLNCNAAGPTPRDPPACMLPLGPTDFVLTLIEEIRTVAPKLSESTLGLALVPPDGRQGYYAYVSYDHARYFSRHNHVTVEKVLGVGTAHELGHLLLGENAHSTTGIMKFAFCGRDLRAGLNWNLWFTPQQSKHIRANLQRREANSHEVASPCKPEENSPAQCVSLSANATRPSP